MTSWLLERGHCLHARNPPARPELNILKIISLERGRFHMCMFRGIVTESDVTVVHPRPRRVGAKKVRQVFSLHDRKFGSWFINTFAAEAPHAQNMCPSSEP